MVEPILESESTALESVVPDPQRPRKLFWIGSRLPSMGCMVTIFSYMGYKDEIQGIVTSICRAGAIFFHQHLDNEASTKDWRLSFPTKKHRYVD